MRRRGSTVPLRRRNLRGVRDEGKNRKGNEHHNATVHGGACGQSRASPVYVDPHVPPSAFADSDSSDN